MSDKKKLIAEGKDFDVTDGITIVNTLSIKEKEEQKVTESAKGVEEAPISTEVSSAIEPEVAVPEIKADPISTEYPSFDIPGLSEVNPLFTVPNSMQAPVIESQMPQNENSLKSDAPNIPATNNDENDFNNVFNSVEYERVATTVTNEKEAEELERVYLENLKKIYEIGPGNQIKILIDTVMEMERILVKVDSQGVVTGLDHDQIKAVLLKVKGLKEIEKTPEYTDNQNEFNLGGMGY